MYVPTFQAPAGVTKYFYDDLQDTLEKVPKRDLLLVMGDFNARVGFSHSHSGLWSDVLGCCGIDEVNQAGEDLLAFCEMNQLLVMNT